MSVAEAALNPMSTMTEEGLLEMYPHARKIIDERSSPFHPLTRQQIYSDLAISREQILRGDVVDFDQAIDEIEVQHGL